METESWVIFKTKPSAEGWEDRKLQPSGSLTGILSEERWYSDRLPKAGDRLRQYENLESPGQGVSHGSDSDWLVTNVAVFEDDSQPYRIVVCDCDYSPVERKWEELGSVDLSKATDEYLTEIGLKPDQFDQVRNRESVGV
ncbi:hypothetical protein D0962_22755 [Leptolyngbyaceae cyanobacterium CCMR0082]|uniref:Uncharacterized protein n=1 Tax=Adonisia turfae CCMR0082 TaxID=2304604 RepID=A0A6M0SBU7_9CYAN|nr:hypothetical protein [Adonisia turfae]NEZ65543.1 hypothetical protein [Adonisia turfae CCMR0082]